MQEIDAWGSSAMRSVTLVIAKTNTRSKKSSRGETDARSSVGRVVKRRVMSTAAMLHLSAAVVVRTLGEDALH